MHDKCMRKLYKTRNDFLEDINLIVCNSITYNGLNNPITENANKVSDFVQTHFHSLDTKYSKLEKKINPLLDDNDQVGFSFLLQEIAQKLKQIPDSSPFHVPVSKKAAPLYRSKVKFPMDLDTLLKNCSRHAYRTQESFLKDVNLILTNSEIFNGPHHVLSSKAREIVNLANLEVSLHADYLSKLERRILETSQKAVESVASSMSPTGFSEISGFSGANLDDDRGARSSSSSDENPLDEEQTEDGPPGSKKPRAMITNLENFFSSVESGTDATSSNQNFDIYENSSFPQFEDSRSNFENSESFLEVKTEHEGQFYPTSSMDGFDSNSVDFARSSGHGLEVGESYQNQDFLMNEESQDPEDMAKLLLGEISESEGEVTDSDHSP